MDRFFLVVRPAQTADVFTREMNDRVDILEFFRIGKTRFDVPLNMPLVLGSFARGEKQVVTLFSKRFLQRLADEPARTGD